MKNFILITMLLVGLNLSGQNDSVYIKQETDEMTGKTYYYPAYKLVVADETTGFAINSLILEQNKFKMFIVKMINIGLCNENNELIILFDNGEKITARSWNKFNCDGTAYFYLTANDKELLRTQTLFKIRILNGRTYESYTGEVATADKRYFIQLFNQMQ